MSYVDLNSNVRWQDAMHTAAGEAIAHNVIPHSREHIVNRRMWQMLMPLLAAFLPPAPVDGSADPYAGPRAAMGAVLPYCPPLTSDQFAEVMESAGAFAAADARVTAGRADGDLLITALDYEAARAPLLALPPVPVPDPVTGVTPPDPLDPATRAQVEAQRAAIQATLDASPQATKDLVAARDAYRASLLPPAPVVPPPPRVPGS